MTGIVLAPMAEKVTMHSRAIPKKATPSNLLENGGMLQRPGTSESRRGDTSVQQIEARKIVPEIASSNAKRVSVSAGSDSTFDDINKVNAKLFGDFLRSKILGCVKAPNAGSKEVVACAFRHLHKGQGHVLTFSEFKDGLGHGFGAQLQPDVIKAMFDLFDTEPRTWQLDFDDFCAWLDTGKRRADEHSSAAPASEGPAASDSKDGRPPNGKERRLSLEQLDRQKLKEHLTKHRSRLHAVQFTDAQKSLADLMLLERIKAKTGDGEAKEGRFDTLKAFRKFTRGEPSGMMQWPEFKVEVEALLKELKGAQELEQMFKRMDSNNDGAIDLTDFMVWVEKVGTGKTCAQQQKELDFWVLEEEGRLRQLKDKKRMGSNPLVPDDYDGSTWIAKLNREKNSDTEPTLTQTEKAALDNLVKAKILGKVKGGQMELLRAFRHFRPAGAGRRLFLDYPEFRDSIKQKGLGLTESEIRELFTHFDLDNSGEIDYAEFRRWVVGDTGATGLHLPGRAAVPAPKGGKDVTGRATESITDLSAEEQLRKLIFSKIGGGQYELLRAFRKFRGPAAGHSIKINEQDFVQSVRKLGINLSDSEGTRLFSQFDGDGSGLIDFNEFRVWATGNDIPNTGLIMVEQADRKKMAAGQERTLAQDNERYGDQSSLAELHFLLREQISKCIKNGPHEVLLAFRGVMRKQGAGINMADLFSAFKTFGIKTTTEQVRELFTLYDRKVRGSINFQEFLEFILEHESLPEPLNRDDREKLNEQCAIAAKALEESFREALTRVLGGRIIDCFASMDPKGCGYIGIPGIKAGLRTVGLNTSVEDRTIQMLLSNYDPRSAATGQPPSWGLQQMGDFLKGGKNASAVVGNNAAADDGIGTSKENGVRNEVAKVERPGTAPARFKSTGGMAEEKIAVHVNGRWKQMLHTFQQLDPHRTGHISESDFEGVLRMSQAVHRLSPKEVKAITQKHGKPNPNAGGDGRYVAYGDFLKHFLITLRARDTSAPAPNAVAGVRATPRSSQGERPSTAQALLMGGSSNNVNGAGRMAVPRALHASASADRLLDNREPSTGYFKRTQSNFTKAGAAGRPVWDKTSQAKAEQAYPTTNVKTEMPKTNDVHRLMKPDVMHVLSSLKHDLKKRESPYRRGVVSAQDFEDVCRANGLAVDNEDISELLRAHRHRTAKLNGAALPTAALKNGAIPSLHYNEFLRTVTAASQMPNAPTH